MSYGTFSSTLLFGDTRADIWEEAVLGSLQFRATDRWTLQASAGAILSGGLVVMNIAHAMRPGWLYGVAASYRILDGTGWTPYLIASGSLSVSGTTTEAENAQIGFHSPLVSMDASLVVTVGKTFFRALSPYLVGRVFGGPVLWQRGSDTSLGGDLYHYQFGVGLAVSLFQRLDAFVEGAPLGERRISAGAGIAF